jgi:lipoprotein-releasing system permease protein
MKLAFFFARRYLFGKKSTNAINLITGISILGITIGTAALILILSVFNGFETLMMSKLDRFNPDLKIIPSQGKFFPRAAIDLMKIKSIDGVLSTSSVIEEVAYFEYENRQQIGILKGVENDYLKTTDLLDVITSGDGVIGMQNDRNLVVVGSGVYNNLDISLINLFTALKIYLPNRRKKNPLDKDFTSRPFYVAGVFRLQNERDNKYIIAEYEAVASLLDNRNQLSAIEIKVDPSVSLPQIKEAISSQIGVDYSVIDRYQQDEAFLKIMNIEKWMSYLIFSFTLILIIFNVIGSLWMIVLDKRKDISILKSMGTTSATVRKIFITAGMLISTIGFGLGFIAAMIFYLLQTNVGIINVPAGYSISSYPMNVELGDVLIIFVTVMSLGLLASIPASIRAGQVSAYVRTE